MKSSIILAGAIALFAGLATANIHPAQVLAIQKKMLCSNSLTRAGLKCKRGDFIRVKRDSEPNKFHISVTDAEGNEYSPEIEDTGFFDENEIV